MRVVVTGGGTGGHIYPALAVAEALRRLDPGVELLYVGGESGPEVDAVPRAGVPFEAVRSRKLRKLISPSTVGVLLAFARGYRQAGLLMRRFAPDVVIGTGGYVAAATSMAAVRQGRPLIIQSCDAVPGRTNLKLARRASRICIWFPESASLLPAGKTVCTGVPLRRDIVSRLGPGEAREALGLKPEEFTVLVVGGSQGAQRLNELVVDAATIMSPPLQVLHQTGPGNYQSVLDRARSRGLSRTRHDARPYLGGAEVPLAYRAADVIICRCGISTLAEVAANGLPALLVPLPTAYADHQTANARAVVRAGAGALLPQADLTAELLARRVSELREDPGARERMAAAGRALGRLDAADNVARLAKEVARV